MKIQLDTKAKTLKVEEAVNLDEFYTLIKKLLPDNEWKKYKLEVTHITHWNNPIVIEKHIDRYPIYPWYGEVYVGTSPNINKVWCKTTVGTSTLNCNINNNITVTNNISNKCNVEESNGVYNIELK